MEELFVELDKIIFEEQMYEKYGFMDESGSSVKEERRKQLSMKIYNNTLTEQEIENNLDIMNFIVWKQVWSYMKCSEDFMEKHIEHINIYAWYEILTNNKHLSEDFIERHTDDDQKFYWDEVFEWQSVSREFCIKHIDKLTTETLRKNTFINQDDFEDVYVALALLNQ